jgi:tRNA modification GTPase
VSDERPVGEDRDTIAAIATPAGIGGISIVRLSGADALSIGSRIVRLRRRRRLPAGRGWSLALGEAVDPSTGEAMGQVIVLVMRAPSSYTGEDVLEIQCYGGRLVTEKILGLALQCGARPAEAGEFTRRAFLSGRISLEQAEAVLDLVNAPSEASLAEAGRRLKGELGSRIRDWEERLFRLLAYLQGAADFPEDVESGLPQAVKELEAVRDEVRGLLARAPLGLALAGGIEVCLVGRPNAGKSSLFNALLRQDRAIVTEVPGTTRDVLRERTEWSGLPVVLLDTAGLRETLEVVEAMGVERARSAAAEAEVIVYLVDDTVGFTEEDARWISRWRDRKLLVVVSKVDVGAGRARPRDIEGLGLPLSRQVRVSCVTGEGLEQVEEIVAAWFSRGGAVEGAVPGSARQVDCLRRAEGSVSQALAQAGAGWTEDVLVLCVEEAARALAELTGKRVSEEALNQVFSRFCVGK